MKAIRSLPLRFALVTATVAWGIPTIVMAAFPERPVTIVVPFAPGGANDVVVRAIQQPLAEALGQPIVVENRGGAGGSLGTGYAARQKPDGYTILMAATGYAVNPSLYDKVHYDPIKDFDPVAEVTTFPVIYAVRPDIGVKSIQELIAYAKTRKGGLNYSTPGAGTLPHLAAELLKLNTGIEMVHIPFAGAAPAAQALLGHTVDVASISISVASRRSMPAASSVSPSPAASAGRSCRTCRPSSRPAFRRRSPIPGKASWCPAARRRRSSTGSPRRRSRSCAGRRCASGCSTPASMRPAAGPTSSASGSSRKCRNGRM